VAVVVPAGIRTALADSDLLVATLRTHFAERGFGPVDVIVE
jgi:hypothetical protein